MKKFYALILLCVVSSTACVDLEYDLSKINTDDIAIGDESSQFEVPLLKVYISMDELTDVDGESIDAVFDEADIWLPSQLPDQDENGNYFASLSRLADDNKYVGELLSKLFNQLVSDPERLGQMASLLQEKYFEDFSPLFPGTLQSEFRAEFIDQYTNNEQKRPQLNGKLEELARGYLAKLDVDLPPISYSVDRVELSDDVVNMLIENLDGKEVAEPKNTLHMAGTIANRLPFSATATPLFTPTEVSFTAEIDANNDANVLPETRIFADDLQTIVRGLTIDINVHVDKYYPGRGFDRGTDGSQPQLSIILHLIKRGALKFDL